MSKKNKPKPIRDRVREIRRVKGSDLLPAPNNWRIHPATQRNALRGVLNEVGISDVLKVWERPDGKLELIDGHLRAEELANQEWPVIILDVTEEEARYLLATHDPLGAMAEADPGILERLLSEISVSDGSVQDMLDALLQGASPDSVQPPDDFKSVDENVETEHECPKCGYRWSGGDA